MYSKRYPVRISFRQTLENMDFDEDSYTCSRIDLVVLSIDTCNYISLWTNTLRLLK